MKYLDGSGLSHLVSKIKGLLAGKVDVVEGKGLSTNDYTTAEKTKLADIEAGAQVNVIETVKVNGTPLTPSGKTVNVDLSNYALKSDIATVYRVKGSCTWAQLIAKTDALVGDVYNVTDKGGANYVCTVEKTAGAESWDKLGETIDLSGYYTKGEIDSQMAGKANSSHSHAIADVSGLQSALNAKVNTTDLVAITNAEIDSEFAS